MNRPLVIAALLLAGFIAAAFVIGIASQNNSGAVASMVDLRREEVILIEDHDVYLVYNNGEPLALSTDSQHVGDEVVFCSSSQLFESPAHGEKFDIQGRYFGGPARSGLDRYPVRVQGDTVSVDLENRIPGPARGGQRAEPQGPFCSE